MQIVQSKRKEAVCTEGDDTGEGGTVVMRSMVLILSIVLVVQCGGVSDGGGVGDHQHHSDKSLALLKKCVLKGVFDRLAIKCL